MLSYPRRAYIIVSATSTLNVSAYFIQFTMIYYAAKCWNEAIQGLQESTSPKCEDNNKNFSPEKISSKTSLTFPGFPDKVVTLLSILISFSLLIFTWAFTRMVYRAFIYIYW